MIRHEHVDAVNSASCCAMRPAGRISNGTYAQGLTFSVDKKYSTQGQYWHTMCLKIQTTKWKKVYA